MGEGGRLVFKKKKAMVRAHLPVDQQNSLLVMVIVYTNKSTVKRFDSWGMQTSS